MGNSYSSKLDISREGELKIRLEKDGFLIKSVDHAFWRAAGSNVTVTFYKSGKLLAQGKGVEAFAEKFLGVKPLPGTPKKAGNSQESPKANYKSWIGTDESGKGDYFGPLVIASVMAEEKNLAQLSNLGIQDSKKLKDSFIMKIAPEIKKISVFTVVTINPAKYNELYGRIKNLNNLLAWGHARAIENILEKTPCQNALSDKFGNESLIKNALMKNGKTINLEQRVRAEEDIAVAAASILARDEFVRRMKKMSYEFGIEFPKGASEQVVKQARKFVEKYGFEKLSTVAKLHFKTTEKVR